MIPIKYVKGDATDPMGEGRKIIIHVCNNCRPGAWGAGFVLALSKRWGQPKSQYLRWSKGQIQKPLYKLGNVQFVRVEDELAVANMIGQHGIGSQNGLPPIRYGALRRCLSRVREGAQRYNCSVHAPYLMGSGLAGGKWSNVEGIINNELSYYDIPVVVYDIGNKR